jgi:hypothetical protein
MLLLLLTLLLLLAAMATLPPELLLLSTAGADDDGIAAAAATGADSVTRLLHLQAVSPHTNCSCFNTPGYTPGGLSLVAAASHECQQAACADRQ